MACDEKVIRKIEITTTQAVDVEQLARDIRASIGHCNITMHAVMKHTYDGEARWLRCWDSVSPECEVIVHINGAVREMDECDRPNFECARARKRKMPS